jgi:hypothetical protein
MTPIAHFETADGSRTETPDKYHTEKDGFVTLLWYDGEDGTVNKKYVIPSERVEFIIEKEQ